MTTIIYWTHILFVSYVQYCLLWTNIFWDCSLMIKTQSFTNLSKLVPIVSYKVNIHLLSNLKLTVFFFLSVMLWFSLTYNLLHWHLPSSLLNTVFMLAFNQSQKAVLVQNVNRIIAWLIMPRSNKEQMEYKFPKDEQWDAYYKQNSHVRCVLRSGL